MASPLPFLAWFPLGDNPACIHVADKISKSFENLHKEVQRYNTSGETGGNGFSGKWIVSFWRSSLQQLRRYLFKTKSS